MDKNNILLESGTGELEIIEFLIDGVHYAINVVKVKEVIAFDSNSLTSLPDPKPEVAGLMLVRDEIITLVDLKYIVTRKSSINKGTKVIICEFNNLKVAFNIDDILGIHRIKWSDIKKPDEIIEDSLGVGNIVINNNDILNFLRLNLYKFSLLFYSIVIKIIL